MLVMYGDQATLLLAITESDVNDLRVGKTLTYFPPVEARFLTQNVIIFYGPDKQAVVNLVKQIGVPITDATQKMIDAYYRGERTDRAKKDH